MAVGGAVGVGVGWGGDRANRLVNTYAPKDGRFLHLAFLRPDSWWGVWPGRSGARVGWRSSVC